MANITLQVGQAFPPGTSVGAYKQSGWGFSQRPPRGEPSGSPDATATVGSDTTLAFTGLTSNTTYYAGAEVDDTWRYYSFTTTEASSGGGTPGPEGPAGPEGPQGPPGPPGTGIAVGPDPPASPDVDDLWVDTN